LKAGDETLEVMADSIVELEQNLYLDFGWKDSVLWDGHNDGEEFPKNTELRGRTIDAADRRNSQIIVKAKFPEEKS
jgi:hypothetical protein